MTKQRRMMKKALEIWKTAIKTNTRHDLVDQLVGTELAMIEAIRQESGRPHKPKL